MTSAKPEQLQRTEPVRIASGRNRGSMQLQAKRFASLVRHGTLELYRFEGQYLGSPIRIIVAEDGSTINYIKKLIFTDEPVTTHIGTISAFSGPGLIHSDADIVIAGANHMLLNAYSNQGFYIVPKWIQLFVPIWDHPDTMYSRLDLDRTTRKYFRRLSRTIETMGYSFAVTVDQGWFDYFYYHMYLPYARRRHQDMAVIHSYNTVQQNFSRGMGVAIMKDGELLGGGIVICEGKTMSFRHMGMVDGSIEASRDGASSALDYFVVRFGHSRGCNQMNFGHTRAFTSDGVLRYKLTWQARVENDDDAISAFAIGTPGTTPQARSFLSENRFFHLTPEGVRLYDES
ncbi:MAG: hypothetical protein ABFD64_09035 [Armatimonadota bacterium]